MATRSILLVPLFLALAASALGCGGGGVNVAEGPMPEGGSFTGVWHSPQYGEMHFQQTGQGVVGEYTKDERRGRVQGTVRGNVMRFEWSEDRELVAGRPITTRGRGYFRYAINPGDGDHYIRGEWGIDDAMSGGGEWNAVRDRRRQPNLNQGGQTSGGSDVEEFDSAGGSSEMDADSDGGGGGSAPARRSGSGDSGGDALDLDGL